MFQSCPSSPSPLYTGISELFWFNSDMLTDEHLEPHKCLATFHVVVFVAGMCLYRGIGEVELLYFEYLKFYCIVP